MTLTPEVEKKADRIGVGIVDIVVVILLIILIMFENSQKRAKMEENSALQANLGQPIVLKNLPDGPYSLVQRVDIRPTGKIQNALFVFHSAMGKYYLVQSEEIKFPEGVFYLSEGKTTPITQPEAAEEREKE